MPLWAVLGLLLLGASRLLGYKTRKAKNPTNKFIVKRRNEK